MPIDAFLFGGRRSTVVPLVREAFDWEHARLHGRDDELGDDRGGRPARSARCASTRSRCCRSAATTWPTTSRTGSRSAERDGAKLPKVFYVNWFRKDADGEFLWPGFGENSRVLAWVFRRCDGDGETVETPIGLVPTPGGLDTEGLDVSDEQLEALLTVDEDKLRARARAGQAST